jgi:serine/threonine protein kinase
MLTPASIPRRSLTHSTHSRMDQLVLYYERVTPLSHYRHKRSEETRKMTDRIGQQLGNYCLLRLLGQGGFAEVYLGEHTYLGTHAAIKILHTRVAQDDISQFQ